MKIRSTSSSSRRPHWESHSGASQFFQYAIIQCGGPHAPARKSDIKKSHRNSSRMPHSRTVTGPTVHPARARDWNDGRIRCQAAQSINRTDALCLKDFIRLVSRAQVGGWVLVSRPAKVPIPNWKSFWKTRSQLIAKVSALSLQSRPHPRLSPSLAAWTCRPR